MFTFILLYIIFYYLTLFFIFFFFTIFNLPKNFLQLNTTELWQTITLYLPYSWSFKLLFLQLTGLPPMIFFFIKLNFLLMSIPYTTIFLQILVFVNILCSCFFYVNLFSIKTTKIYNNNLKLLTKNNSTLSNNFDSETHLRYKFFFSLFIFFFLTFFSIFFFFDIYVYVNNFFY